ncbi:hypothetical protein, partial [Heyndrickxia coagulans]
IGKITLAKANRNSSPTYSLVLFAPSHSLRMRDFFRKAVKIHAGQPVFNLQGDSGFPGSACPGRCLKKNEEA